MPGQTKRFSTVSRTRQDTCWCTGQQRSVAEIVAYRKQAVLQVPNSLCNFFGSINCVLRQSTPTWTLPGTVVVSRVRANHWGFSKHKLPNTQPLSHVHDARHVHEANTQPGLCCMQENYQPGLLGQPMLEDQPPAVVPVRIPGQPTTNYNVSLGSWAAAASMALFYPELAPTGLNSGSCHPAAAQQGHAGSPAQPAPIKQEAGDGTGSDAPPPPAAGAAAASGGGGDGGAGGSAGSDSLYRRYHGCVLDLPAAEALHLQSQLKARLEAGEAGAPPDGMYILPLELTDKPVGANAAGAAAGSGPAGGTPTPGSTLQPAASAGAASSGQGPEAPEVKSPPAAGHSGPGGGNRGTPGAAGGASIGLDEVRASQGCLSSAAAVVHHPRRPQYAVGAAAATASTPVG